MPRCLSASTLLPLCVVARHLLRLWSAHVFRASQRAARYRAAYHPEKAMNYALLDPIFLAQTALNAHALDQTLLNPYLETDLKL